MILKYNEYLEKEKSLSFEQMNSIHDQMLDEISGDTNALGIYEELIEKANKYAAIRAEWSLWDKTKKMERDDSRRICHDSLIVKFNMLARYLRIQGKESSWRDELGYEEGDRYNRKRIGDFACYMVFINSINSI